MVEYKIDSKVEISVKDNGHGIPEKILEKIFQPFLPPNQQDREQAWDYRLLTISSKRMEVISG